MLFHLRSLKLALCLFIMLSAAAYAEIAAKSPAVWNLHNANLFFVGRKAILEQLHSNFSQNNQIITIVGNAGIGKSQIAKKYAEDYNSSYEIVWWVDGEKNVSEQMKALAVEWNRIHKNRDQQVNVYMPQEEIISKLKEHLRVTNHNWLIIFDNVADKSQITLYLPEKHGSSGFGHVLVTSKNPTSWSDVMNIDKFSRAESVELLAKILSSSNAESQDKMANTLNDFPLALVQAAAYIKSHPSVTIDDYLTLFVGNRNILWGEEEKLKTKHSAFDNYEFTVNTTMSLTVKNIQKELLAAYDLLVFCSFLNSKNIPTDLMKHYLKYKNKTDVFEQSNIIAALVNYSLISVSEDTENKGGEQVFAIHEMTQFAVQNMLNDSRKAEYMKDSLAALNGFYSDKLDINVPLLFKRSYLLTHLQSAIHNSEVTGISNDDLISLRLRELEYYLSGNKDFDTSGRIIEKLLQKDKMSDLNKCRLHLMLSSFYGWRDSDYIRMIDESLHAVQLTQGKQNVEDDILMAYNRIAQAYNSMGDNDNALKYAKLGEEIINTTKSYLSGKDAIYFCLAKISMHQGDLMNALEYIEKTISYLEGHEDVVGNDLPIYKLKAEILLRSGHYPEALREFEKLYVIAEKNLPSTNQLPHITMIMKSYAAFLSGETNAIEDLKKAQSKLKSVMNNTTYYRTRSAALSYRYLGEMYEKQGENVKAQQNYYISLQIYNNMFNGSAQAKNDDLSDVYARLAMINVKLREPASAMEYLKMHRELFGFEHVRSVMIEDAMMMAGMSVEY